MDIERRRERHEPPAGRCWVASALLAGEPFLDCQPGPWLSSQVEVEAFRKAADRYVDDHPGRLDEHLLLAVTFVHVGSPVMVFLAGRPQYHLLGGSPSDELLVRLAPLRWDGTAEFLAQQQLWALGQEVLATDDPLFRKQWHRLWSEVERPGPYSYGEFEVLLEETPDDEFIWHLPLTWSETLAVHGPSELRWQQALRSRSLQEAE